MGLLLDFVKYEIIMNIAYMGVSEGRGNEIVHLWVVPRGSFFASR